MRVVDEHQTKTTEERIADALTSLAAQVKYLGAGDAGSTMGAVEFLAVEVREGTTRIANALEQIAQALRDREE
jgi:hypothetical protein